MTAGRFIRVVLAVAAGLTMALAAEGPREYIYRPVSVSFVPGLSTNGAEGRNVSTRFSLNVIGGYLGRLNGVELGSVFNIEEDEALGYQAAGAINIVGGSFTGVQQAGAVNIAGERLSGAQMAGAVNLAGGDVEFLQAAGAVNVAGNNMSGAQLAGAVNLTGGLASGLQMAGAVNIADEFSGAQIGVVNITGKGHGLQLGVVNIAGDVDVPIGIVSIVENGQFHVNAWASEVSLVNIGIKTGSKSIYNVFALGFQPGGDSTRLLAGLGIGGHIPLNRFFVDIDAVSHNVYTGPDWFVAGGPNLLSSLRLTGGWQIIDGLALTAGPTLNVWVSDREDGSAVPLYDAPLFHSEGGVNVRIWPGFTAGLQLL